jgi:transposase
LIRSLVRQAGYRMPSGSSRQTSAQLARVALPGTLVETLAPVRRMVEALTTEIASVDQQLRRRTAADPIVQRLQSVPGVGPVVAITFRATLDEIGRFAHAGQVSARLGLVPREDSSAERRHRGHITKAGPRELRSLLVQAAWACWRSKGCGALRAWVERLACRRGKRIAVAPCGTQSDLYAVWRDGAMFDATKLATA